MNSSKNYTIVFGNNEPGKKPQGTSSEETASIGDYYKNKFGGRRSSALDEITEEEGNEGDAIKKNNFVTSKSVRKIDRDREEAKEEERRQSAQREKLVKGPSGWRRESQSEKDIQGDSRVTSYEG